MAIGFKVKSDLTGVVNYLNRLRYGLNDLREPLANAAAELTRRVKRRFITKVDPDGNLWKPWARSTALQRQADRAKGKNVSLMVYDGKLRDGVRFIAGRSDLRAYYSEPYGVFHEQPNGRGNGNKLARRAFLLSARNPNRRSLSVEDEQYVLNALRYQVRKWNV